MNDSRGFFASAASWVREIVGAMPREISQAITEMDAAMEAVTIPNKAENDSARKLVDAYDEQAIAAYPLSKYVTHLMDQQPVLPSFEDFMDLAKKMVAAEDAGATPPPPPCVGTPVEPEAVGAVIACVDAVRGDNQMLRIEAETMVGQAHQGAERAVNARKAAAVRVALVWCREHRSALAAKRRQTEAMAGVVAMQGAERERHAAALGRVDLEVRLGSVLSQVENLLTAAGSPAVRAAVSKALEGAAALSDQEMIRMEQ